jgi:hypothetical protein
MAAPASLYSRDASVFGRESQGQAQEARFSCFGRKHKKQHDPCIGLHLLPRRVH